MFSKIINTSTMTIIIGGMLLGCAPKNNSNNNNGALSVVTSNLSAVHDQYVPESISDDGSSSSSSSSAAATAAISSNPNDDVCAGLDMGQCQARLIRLYLLFGRAAVGLTGQVVVSIAQDLENAPDNSSGTFHSDTQNITVEYNKQSLLSFDFLLIAGSTPVGHVTANNGNYDIQLDSGYLDQGKPGSRGGMLDIQVQYTDDQHWQSQITVTGLDCNVSRPSDPTAARISVTRNGDMWNGQSTFYNGVEGAFNSAQTCSAVPNDNTGLVTYTDFVADHVAAKASLYIMKRSETSTASIQNYGFNDLCSNYSDLCQNVATSLSTTPAAVQSYLTTISNPYCVQRGAPDVTWNDDCSSLSPGVAAQPFSANSSWVTPNAFYQLNIVIPASL